MFNLFKGLVPEVRGLGLRKPKTKENDWKNVERGLERVKNA